MTDGRESAPGGSPADQDRLFRAVIAWKVVRGALAFVAGILLLAAVALGATERLIDGAHALRVHVTAGWSLRLVAWLVPLVTRTHLLFGALALIGDGVLSLVEGWALHTRRIWGEWLVVVATSVWIPFELEPMVRHASVPRVVALAGNVAIVVYLALRATRQMEERRRARG